MTLASIVLALLAGIVAAADAPTPLVINPENTVILNRGGSHASFLQYFMIWGYVGEAEAAPYHFDVLKVDRAGAPWFPVVRETPAGKHILAVGDWSYLTNEEQKVLLMLNR